MFRVVLLLIVIMGILSTSRRAQKPLQDKEGYSAGENGESSTCSRDSQAKRQKIKEAKGREIGLGTLLCVFVDCLVHAYKHVYPSYDELKCKHLSVWTRSPLITLSSTMSE